jgi:hypothetical protein
MVCRKSPGKPGRKNPEQDDEQVDQLGSVHVSLHGLTIRPSVIHDATETLLPLSSNGQAQLRRIFLGLFLLGFSR